MVEVIWTQPAPKAGPKPVYSMAEVNTEGATPETPVVIWSPQLSSDTLQLPPDHIREVTKKVEAQHDCPAKMRRAIDALKAAVAEDRSHAPATSAIPPSGPTPAPEPQAPPEACETQAAGGFGVGAEPKCGESLFETPSHRIITGDALTILRSLPAGSVHCVVTSPPYWAQRIYSGVDGQVWGGDPECSHQWVTLPTVNQRRSLNEGMSEKQASVGGNLVEYAPGDDCALCGAWRGMLGLEPVPDCHAWARGEEPCSRCYICHLRIVTRELWRVLRNDGTLWINLGDKFVSSTKWGSESGGKNATSQSGGYPRAKMAAFGGWLPDKNMACLPWRLGLALQADGWYLRQSNIWHKPNGVPHPVKDRPVTNHEYVLLLTKRPRYYYDNEAVKQKARRTASGNKARRFGGEYDRGDHHVGYSIPWQGEKSQLRSVWTRGSRKPVGPGRDSGCRRGGAGGVRRPGGTVAMGGEDVRDARSRGSTDDGMEHAARSTSSRDNRLEVPDTRLQVRWGAPNCLRRLRRTRSR